MPVSGQHPKHLSPWQTTRNLSVSVSMLGEHVGLPCASNWHIPFNSILAISVVSSVFESLLMAKFYFGILPFIK